MAISRRLLLPTIALCSCAAGAPAPVATPGTAVTVPAAPQTSSVAAPEATARTTVASAEPSGPEPIATGAPEPAPAPAAPDEALATANCKDVTLTLAIVTRNGEKRFSATLSNRGKKPVTLVEAGDGSEAGWRTPMLEWIATTPAGKPAQPVQVGRCGLTNPIDEREVFTLAPGQSKTMIDWLDQPRVVKGHYDVRLVYKNDPHHGSTGKGGMSPAAAAKIAASTPCKVTSSPIGYDAP